MEKHSLLYVKQKQVKFSVTVDRDDTKKQLVTKTTRKQQTTTSSSLFLSMSTTPNEVLLKS